MPLLDDWLPDFDVGEQHDIALPVDAERAIELAMTCPAAPDRLVRLLLTARGMTPRELTIEDFFRSNRFDVIETPTAWAARITRGKLRIAIEFRAERIPGGSRLTTETRVRAEDDKTRRAFRRYWRVIAPFSALIRRRWLRAVQAAAIR